MQAQQAEKPANKQMRKLQVPRLQEASFSISMWCATTEEGVSVEEMKDPMFWANVSSRFRPGDIIIVRPDDGSFFAELIVRSAGRNWAQVDELRHVKFSANLQEVTEISQHKVEYAGPHAKHRVLRIADKHVLKDGFETKELAEKWRVEHERALKR